MAVTRGPTLYEFLLETELSHYFSPLKNELKVHSVAQLKYVEEDDLAQLGMSKPEQRRLRKYFQKYYPQTYLRKIKNMILPKSKDDVDRSSVLIFDSCTDRSSIKVPSKHIIPMDSIVINKELGVGEFGVVQQGVWTNEEGERVFLQSCIKSSSRQAYNPLDYFWEYRTPKSTQADCNKYTIMIQVAIKCLSEERMQKNHMEFLKEAAIMHTIDHENIVRLYGVVLETNALMLVTELAPLRSLLECLKEPALRQSFPVVSLSDFALQICDGMQYLENKKLIHRDLAARNVLVFAKNKIKISDFGLSRALGVGKDYYQTNFNVNLKLPIAWCAPECINYLRFTSASDVWAYGVTLWEMFSYGFQPWAALTGQQILEAIDEPNFQRLEQPECCPKEYYTLMLKCWQHEASQRPKFSEIYQLLPECKPEQVQAVCDSSEILSASKPKREWLQYHTGEIITVLDKRPLPDNQNVWKGILNSGKTGLFDPAHTVAYLGQNIPNPRATFSRLDSKTGIYASRRRLRREMISSPQGDFKHTGHVGLDGAYFGDVSFLGDKHLQLPKQVVSPYKPQDDRDSASPVITNASDSSDRVPLLTNLGNLSDGKNCPSESVWSDCSWERNGSKDSENVTDKTSKKSVQGRNGKSSVAPDHEYHEISDEDNLELVENSKFESLDLGPSLMDEVFRALGTSKPDIDYDEKQCNENNNVKNEIKEITSKVGREGFKKKQALVKPISAADQQTLDSAIAMAKELASKSMLELDTRSDGDTPLDSPKTPTSPFKRKFSFKFKTSPKPDRRNFSEEAEAIPDIQDIITDEAKEAYNSLVEKGQGFEKGLSLTPVVTAEPIQESASVCCQSPSHQPQCGTGTATDSCDTESELVEANPLRMLRSGVPVRPKIRGNRHGIPVSGRATTPHTATVARLAANAALPNNNIANCSRPNLGSPPPPPPPSLKSVAPSACITAEQQKVGISASENIAISKDSSISDISSGGQQNCSTNQNCTETSSSITPNPLPLPPRDRSKPLPVLKQHQRKHPLILPVSADVLSCRLPLVKQISCPDVPSQTMVPTEADRRASEGGIDISTNADICSFESQSPSNNCQTTYCTSELGSSVAVVPPPKPVRSLNLDDSFETEIQAEIESLDNIPEEESQTLYKGGDHVSCEDLLEFALDKPNSRRTQGRASGVNSDEVRIMQKVLAGEYQVSSEDCLVALNETDWDIHKAIKLIRLQCILRSHLIPHDNWKQILMKCNWNVQQATNILLATRNIGEDTTEV